MQILRLDAADPASEKPAYRAFRLSTKGCIEGVEIILAHDDEEAEMLAARMANGHGVDLWDRLRFLATFPPLSPSRPGAKA